MLSAVSVLAIAPLAPLLRDELGLSRAQVGLFLPAVYLGGVLMSLPAGWLTDRLGIRVTLTGGLALTGLMIGAAAQAPTLPLTLSGFFLAGLGFAVINPTTGKAIIERFPPRERGFAMGVKQTGLTLGGVTAALTVPAIGLSRGWRAALTTAAAASLAGAAAALVGFRSRASAAAPAVLDRPRLAEVAPFLARPSFIVLMASGFALSINQSSLLAYFALFARESQGLGVVAAGGLLALAQAGGTAGRIVWGIVSDRAFGGRRRPGLVLNATLSAAMSLLFASGLPMAGPTAACAAVLAGVGAFGWVGLYLALAAEVGGPRYAGLLTGVAVACAWSGVLVGPTLFGGLLETTGGYRWPWLGVALTGLGAAIALSRIPPLVKRPPLER